MAEYWLIFSRQLREFWCSRWIFGVFSSLARLSPFSFFAGRVVVPLGDASQLPAL